jgi:hypothetical protein
MRQTTRYVAASTVIVVTMIGSSLVTAKVIRANTGEESPIVQIETIAKVDNFDKALKNFDDLGLKKGLKLIEGEMMRDKLKNIREQIDNSELLDVLKLTPSEFKEYREEGKSLKEIAASQNVDLEKVKEVVEKQMIEKWERLLSNGIINAEKYDELVSMKDEILERHLNSDGTRLHDKMKSDKGYRGFLKN